METIDLSPTTHLPVRSTVECRAEVTYDEFRAEYLYPRRPVVLTDLTREWPAMTRWKPTFFQQELGNRKVILSAGRQRYRTTLRWFGDYLNRHRFTLSTPSTTPPLYLRNLVISQELPDLAMDFMVPKLFTPNWFDLWPIKEILPVTAPRAPPQLFIGTPAASLPVIHRDTLMTHAWITQIYGKKQVWLVAPSQEACVYPSARDRNHSMVNSLQAPDFEQFPLMRSASVYTVLLQPGDTLFVPAGWWHAAECLTISIGISGNFVNESNFDDFLQETHTDPHADEDVRSSQACSLLPTVGEICRTAFPASAATVNLSAYLALCDRA